VHQPGHQLGADEAAAAEHAQVHVELPAAALP
jgi:hypothetical protein